jgi:hypothetical protein
MMPGVDPGEKVQEQYDEDQEYYRMKYDHVFPVSGRGIDISETDGRGGHEAEIDEIEPGMGLSLQQVQSAVNDGKIESDLDVVQEEEQDRSLGRTGFVENLGGKEKGRDIENRFRQKIAGYCLDEDIRIPSRKQEQERKEELQQYIKFDGQLFIGRTVPAEAIADVYPRIKELLQDKKKPKDLLQTYINVRFIVPDLVQI